ncbi:MAG: 2-amino-4-hydroxy-6-hydroxymethyldihydropteridine diphosphokinase [Acidimicrobiaceae bacterium]|nr:2-amino-4-hydroxy-6-hydroxymethyldihydropteridine diphosphokinase [Acidimicrobiaceae bacterium]HAY52167.1 2-amino-4-hydroxy-6-hydroxymethyldihydropteridine diphosphokinase [Acidimicrobiaceae bacterium]
MGEKLFRQQWNFHHLRSLLPREMKNRRWKMRASNFRRARTSKRSPLNRGRTMPQAFLGLGSNLGDRMQFLQDAVEEIPDLVGVSGVYETDPIGGPDQSKFLNIVVELETDLSPRDLLNLAQALEKKADRRREVHWGPRTLDVDVLWVEGHKVNDHDLEVPHPRMRERAFVMVPLGELSPDFLSGWVDSEEGQVSRISDW